MCCYFVMNCGSGETELLRSWWWIETVQLPRWRWIVMELLHICLLLWWLCFCFVLVVVVV